MYGPPDSWFNTTVRPIRTWKVITAIGSRQQTRLVEARKMTEAILAAQELAGPRARLVACLAEGDW